MKKVERIKKKINDFMFDHFILSRVLGHGKQLILSVLAASIFAFGFCSFATPYINSEHPFTIVTGGLSGISQNIALVIELITGHQIGHNTIQAISYFALNLPLIIFAFFKIGKRFSIYTLINVAATSGFMTLFSMSGGVGEYISANTFIDHQAAVLVRVIFAGVCTGLSSAIAFRADSSCGGVDIVTYYFALRKSTTVGKYGAVVNGVVVSLYGILLMVKDPSDWDQGVISILFSIAYLMTVALIIDAINLRNKKVQLTFISKNPNLSHVLIANFPHGATEVAAHGAYSGAEEIITYMVVTSYEVKKVIALAKRVDDRAFITVTPLSQVYGKFFIKPIE